jgi:glycosyltransferase involved in cell wall biosynthesis
MNQKNIVKDDNVINIGLSIIGLSKDTGGIYQHSISLIETLLKLKNITLIIFYSDKDLNNEWFFDVQNVRTVFIPKLKFKKSVIRNISLLLKGIFGLDYRIKNYFKEYLAIDNFGCEMIFHTNWNAPIIVSTTPAISSIHDCAPYTMPFALMSLKSRIAMHVMLKMILNKSNHLISESKQGKKEINKFYNIANDKITIINNTPSSYIKRSIHASNVYSKYGINKGYFFLPGRWGGYKNTKIVLDCFEELYKVEKSISIVLSGMKDDERERCDFYIKNFSSRSKIHNIGFVDDNEMPSLYQGSIILLFPTLLGPSSLPVYESMKLGKSVIVPNIPEYPDLVKDSGIIVDPNSAKEIFNAMLYVIKNKDSIKIMGKKGKKIIESIEAIPKEKILDEIIQKLK